MNVGRRAVSFLLLVGIAGPIAARQPDRQYSAPEPYYAPPAPLQPYQPPYQSPYLQQPSQQPSQPPYSRPPYLDTRPGDAFADPPRGYPIPPRHYPTPPRAWPQNNLPPGNLPQNNLPQGNFPQNNYRNPRP